MAMALDWPRTRGLTWPERIVPRFRLRPVRDEPLQAVLAKKDDRLLDDVGLSRQDLTGRDEAMRAEWARTRLRWML